MERLKRYLKGVLPEMPGVLICAVAFAYMAAAGFHVDVSLQNDLLLTGLYTLAVVAILYFAAYSHRNIVIGVVVLVVWIAVTLALTHAGAGVFDDTEQNHALYFAVLFACAIGAFLLTRTRITSIIMFVVGLSIAGILQFLYPNGYLVALVAFACATTFLVLYRGFTSSFSKAKARCTFFASASLASIVVTLLAVVLSCGIYFLVIAPLNPPTREVKLVTEYLSYQVLDVTGVADFNHLQDPRYRTNRTNDQTKQDQNAQDKQQVDSNKQDEKNPEYSQTSGNPLFDLITYEKQAGPWVIVLQVLILLLVLSLPFVIKHLLRNRFSRHLEEMSPERAVRSAYLRHIKIFKRIGIRKPQQATPLEFARNSEETLQLFSDNASKTSFLRESELYTRVVYGDGAIDPTEWADVRSFHDAFQKNVKAYLGTLRYLLRYFIL